MDLRGTSTYIAITIDVNCANAKHGVAYALE